MVPYDESWPERFEQERTALTRFIRPWVSGEIHHVGSTAVPGLDAKPIIDILVGVVSLEASRGAFGPLAGLNYLYAPYRTEEMHWFCKPDPSRRTHHLHLVPVGSRRFKEELAFRDRLRADQQVAAEYAALKHELPPYTSTIARPTRRRRRTSSSACLRVRPRPRPALRPGSLGRSLSQAVTLACGGFACAWA